MSSVSGSNVKFEIGHVLFIDIVGYSKLLINEQGESLQELNQVVRGTDTFRAAEAANQLTRIPTGDGMALVFSTTPDAPVQCALQIAKALKDHPGLRVRMGIHSGPVSAVTDVNDRSNIAGGGINTAQRVMDCADAGHILLSKRLADDLAQYRQWRPFVHELGECEVKHGDTIALYNFFGDDFGNSATPAKLIVSSPARPAGVRQSRRLGIAVAVVSVMIAGAIIAFLSFRSKPASAPSVSGPTAAAPGGKIAPPPSEKGIAVLPFENLSEDKANAYFADGIQDEILTRLANVAELKVISRISTQRYKSKPDNLREIAQALGVVYLLEGSVQKAGETVHVNVQLVNALTDSHLWAQSFDGQLGDIFGFEGEVAKTVAEALRAKLTGHEREALAVKPTSNAQAYDAYLRGISMLNRYNMMPQPANEALGFYQQAVNLDPNFAVAWAQLSIAHSRLYFLGADRTPQRAQLAKEGADKALALQPDLPESGLAIGYYEYWVKQDLDKAFAAFSKAVARRPNDAETTAALSYVERRQGKFEEALAHGIRTTEIDPQNMPFLRQLSLTYYMLKRFSEAEVANGRCLNISPDDAQLHSDKARMRLSQGDIPGAERAMEGIRPVPEIPFAFELQIRLLLITRRYGDAIRVLEEALANPPPLLGYRLGEYLYLLAWSQQLAGNESGARHNYLRAREELKKLIKEQPGPPELYLGLVYAGLGDKEAAIRAAQTAVAARPTSSDHLFGPAYEEALARVRAQIGDKNAAIEDLRRLVTINSLGPEQWVLTPGMLRLDPIWDPIRDDPGFQKLAAAKQ
jgi:TolB-like protein/Tfp pilus assembly protein PilF